MKSQPFNATLLFYPKSNPKLRLFALWYLTTLMVVWNILGHTFLGFEQVVGHADRGGPGGGAGLHDAGLCRRVGARAPGSFYSESRELSELPAGLPDSGICVCDASLCERATMAGDLCGGPVNRIEADLSGSGRGGHTQHIFNPSNFGVGATLLLFPDVSFAPPYHFTENITGAWDWALPLIVLFSGVLVHGLFTGRLPLVSAWIAGFILQAVFRARWFGTPFFVPLMPMTSAAFIIFTLYMIPDPATTPLRPARQALFGFSVAMVYGVIQLLHLVFGLFFALLIVCAVRGLALHVWALSGSQFLQQRQSAAPVTSPAA